MARKMPPGFKNRKVRYGLYFDESERQETIYNPDTRKWEATGKVAYVYTSAMIKDADKKEIEDKLLKLREKITEEVIRFDSTLIDYKDLKDGKLLELHAVDLYNSGGVFRKIKDKDKDFYHKQHEWLDEAVKIATSGKIKYLFYTSTDEQIKKSWEAGGDFGGTILKELDIKSVKERILSFTRNPYFLAFPILLSQLNHYTKSINGKAEMFCHTHYDAQGYSTLDLYDMVRARGHYTNLSSPKYKTCSEEPLIQCADIIGYVILQEHFSNYLKKDRKPEFRNWWVNDVIPQIIWNFYDPDLDEKMSISALAMEFILTNGGGPKEFQEAVKGTVAKVLKQSMSGAAGGWVLSRQGLRLVKPR